MRIVLGYLNQLEMISNLNIGNIMQIIPAKIEELLSVPRNETEFNRESFIDKIALLWVSYFWISTEIRFIIQLKEDEDYDKKIKGDESEYWHAKSLEIAWTFLPSDCPLLNHILLSYQKHHAPSQQTINEDLENDQNLVIIKPLKGIEIWKFMPIVRKIDSENIAITPSVFSPADTITNRKMILSYQSYLNYGLNLAPQGNSKSNLLDYSSNKDKSRNTGTTRHWSVSPNVIWAENESLRSSHSKKANLDSGDKEEVQKQNLTLSGRSQSKSNQANVTSDKHIIDKLLDFIMKDKQITDKDKLLEALLSEDFDFEEKLRQSKNFIKGKDSLLVDSEFYNNHSTSYKEMRHEDSFVNEVNELDSNKVNMTEDFGKLQPNDKKQEKDMKFISKLIDRSWTNHKKVRPKSSKSIRQTNLKTGGANTALTNNKNSKINQKGTDYLNSIIKGNQSRGKQTKSK